MNNQERVRKYLQETFNLKLQKYVGQPYTPQLKQQISENLNELYNVNLLRGYNFKFDGYNFPTDEEINYEYFDELYESFWK